MDLPHDQAILPLAIYQKDPIFTIETLVHPSSVLLYLQYGIWGQEVGVWNQSKYLLANETVTKMWYTHTMGFSAVKKTEIVKSAGK